MEHLAGIVISVLLLLALLALITTAIALRIERRHPPTGRFIEVDGVNLHYVERGRGTPVVLLHGNGAMIADYQASGILDRLSGHHRVIAFDRPGFGHSSRPRSRAWTPQAQAALFAQAFDRLGVSQPVIVGHSWGTLVAMALGQDFPGKVHGLLLLSGYYFPTARVDVPLLSVPAIPILGDVVRYTLSPLLGWLLMPKIVRKLFEPAAVSPRFDAGFPSSMTIRPWQIRAAAEETALMIPATVALKAHYRDLKVPVIIIGGDGDRIVDTREQSARLAQEVAGSEFHMVSHAGHMVHYLAPESIVAAVDKLGR